MDPSPGQRECTASAKLQISRSKAKSPPALPSKSPLKRSPQLPRMSSDSRKSLPKTDTHPTVASTPQMSGQLCSHNSPMLSESPAVQTEVFRPSVTVPEIPHHALSHSLSCSPKKEEGRKDELSTNECGLCRKTSLKQVVDEQIYNKYELAVQGIYNMNIVNDLILSANTQLVSAFKEHLIYDDATEVLKRLYDSKTSRRKVKDLTELYDKSSKIFPNFILLDEKKYMFKNIQRKQKLINQKEKRAEERKAAPPTEKIFSRKFLAEVTMRCSRIVPAGEKGSLAELVSRFIDKDSLSLIRRSRCEAIECSLLTSKGPAPSSESKPLTSNKKPRVLNMQSAKNSKQPNASTKNNYRRSESQKKIAAEKPASGRGSTGKNYKANRPKEILQPKTRLERNAKPFTTTRQVAKIDPLQININLNLIFGKNQANSKTPRPCTSNDFHAFKHQNKLSPKGSTVTKFESTAKQPFKKVSKPIAASSTKSLHKKPIHFPAKAAPVSNAKANPKQSAGQRKGTVAIDQLCKDVRELLSTVKGTESRSCSTAGEKVWKKGKKNEVYFHQKTNSETMHKRLHK